jgi:hypothetical protein
VSLPFETVASAPVAVTTSDDETSRSEAPGSRAVAVDLQSPLMQFGAIDGTYVVLKNIYPGRSLFGRTLQWRRHLGVGAGELEELHAILPGARQKRNQD